MSTTNCNCPCCGAPLAFSGATTQLECASCGNSFDPESISAFESEGVNSDITFAMPEESLAGENVCGFTCKNCGADLMTDDTTTATECPYCGSPTIIPARIESGVKPEYVLPFRVTKEEATNAFHSYFKGKKLMPNIFLNGQNRISEMRKLYVPYWLFDCDAQASMVFNAEKVHTERRGEWEIRTTEHYMACRSGAIGFDSIPVDGSEKLDDKISESLEPYVTELAVPFQPAVLAGAMADHADVDADACLSRAVKRVENSVESAIRDTVKGYSRVQVRSRNIYTRNGKVTPILAPVWLITTEKNDGNAKKTYTFAINGQTGKLTTDVQPDASKSFIWGAGVFAAVMLVAVIAMLLLNSLKSGTIFLSAIAALIVALITVSVLRGQLKTAAQQDSAVNYVRKNSFQLHYNRDLFLYKNVERKKIENSQPSSEGGASASQPSHKPAPSRPAQPQKSSQGVGRRTPPQNPGK